MDLMGFTTVKHKLKYKALTEVHIKYVPSRPWCSWKLEVCEIK